jgi:hypothetical protein
VEKRFACVRSRSAVRPSRRLPRERTELQTVFRSCIRLPGDATACFYLLPWDCFPLGPCGLVSLYLWPRILQPASNEFEARPGARNTDFILRSANDAFGVLKMLEPAHVYRKTSFLGCWCATRRYGTRITDCLLTHHERRLPGRGTLCHGGWDDTWANPTSKVILPGSRDLARQRLTVQNRKLGISVIPMALLICQFLRVPMQYLDVSLLVGVGSGEEAENEFGFERRCKSRPWGSGSPLTTMPPAEFEVGRVGYPYLSENPASSWRRNWYLGRNEI